MGLDQYFTLQNILRFFLTGDLFLTHRDQQLIFTNNISLLWLRINPCLLHISSKTDISGEGRKGRQPYQKEKKRNMKTSINYCPVISLRLLLVSCLYGFQLRTQGKMDLAIFPASDFSWHSLFISRHRDYITLQVSNISLCWRVYEQTSSLCIQRVLFFFFQYTKTYNCHYVINIQVSNVQVPLSW